MNKEQLERTRRENFNKLDTAYRPKINAVEIDINNSIEHELVKFVCVWLIRKGIPANLLQGLILRCCRFFRSPPDIILGRIYKEFEKDFLKFEHEWQRPQVVTEARFKGTQRRADIFILDTGEIVEIETKLKVEKRGDNVITVRI